MKTWHGWLQALWVWLLAAGAWPVLGCGGSTKPSIDGGIDASDGDAGNGDAGKDGADAGGDFEGPWDGCPTAKDFRGGGWSKGFTLSVSPEATYCFTFDSTISVEEQQKLKTQAQIASGEYDLPAEDGTFSLTLPVCLRFGSADERLESAGDGTAVQKIQNGTFALDICQPYRSRTGDAWALQLNLYGSMPPKIDLVLDNQSLFDNFAWMALHKGRCDDLDTILRYQSCNYDWLDWARRQKTVRFAGGEVALEVRLPRIDSTVYGLFYAANGTLDGTAFSQRSYWKLSFYSVLHFYFCDFLVLFDEPIGRACGIRIDELLLWDDGANPERKLELVDCELKPIEERTILSVTEGP